MGDNNLLSSASKLLFVLVTSCTCLLVWYFVPQILPFRRRLEFQLACEHTELRPRLHHPARGWRGKDALELQRTTAAQEREYKEEKLARTWPRRTGAQIIFSSGIAGRQSIGSLVEEEKI